MAYWLLKTEPSEFSFSDLTRDKKTTWSGVTNATALIHIRKMKKGDAALIYHTVDERSAVGMAEIASDPYPDPKEKNEKLAVVEVRAKKLLAKPVSLDQIKSDKAFEGFDLLRISRLSVVPVPPAMWKRLMTLAGEK